MRGNEMKQYMMNNPKDHFPDIKKMVKLIKALTGKEEV